MRIIAFVGSPVEDNEKDVSSKSCITFCAYPTEGNVFIPIIHYRFNIFSHCLNLPMYVCLYSSQPAGFAAGQVGKALEKRESECGYYQLRRRGE